MIISTGLEGAHYISNGLDDLRNLCFLCLCAWRLQSVCIGQSRTRAKCCTSCLACSLTDWGSRTAADCTPAAEVACHILAVVPAVVALAARRSPGHPIQLFTPPCMHMSPAIICNAAWSRRRKHGHCIVSYFCERNLKVGFFCTPFDTFSQKTQPRWKDRSPQITHARTGKEHLHCP